METEFDIRTAEDVERQRIEGFSERSAFSDMKRQAVERYQKECIEFEIHEKFPEKNQKYFSEKIIYMPLHHITYCLYKYRVKSCRYEPQNTKPGNSGGASKSD